MNFLKLSVHVFCLAEKAKLCRTNSRTNCKQNKITVCHTWMKMLWEKVSMFGIIVTTPLALGGFLREGDDFIMQVILWAGYNSDEVKRINRVRVSMQVLFMSDILTASEHMIAPDILSPRPRGETRSSMRWPNEQPTSSDMTLWRNAMQAICPSRCLGRGVGRFIKQTHWIWNGIGTATGWLYIAQGTTESQRTCMWQGRSQTDSTSCIVNSKDS